MIRCSSTGIVAMALRCSRRPGAGLLCRPRAALRQAEQRTPASRTDLLVVVGALLRRHLVREAQFALDRGEIADHHRRRVRAIAAPAPRLFPATPRVLVEADADLRGTLEDVEQL